MKKRVRTPALAAALLISPLLAACARGPDVQSGLGLRRVVIYRNGVGYYERAGHVSADEVTFKVRTEKVGDFLATLAVMEQGGSSVRSASFPVEVVKKPGEADDADELDDDVDPRFEVLLKPPPKKKGDKPKDKLETVRLTMDGREHDLVVGYVAETPVWKPSYRLVVSATGSAELQAWGIVQNLSGEDWKGVHLTLVAGAPLAFQATLEKAVIPDRPIVTDRGEVIASVPTSETSLAEEPPPPPPIAAATPGMAQAPRDEAGYGYEFGDDAEGEVAGGTLRGRSGGGKKTADKRDASPNKNAPRPKGPAGSTASATRRNAEAKVMPPPSAPPPPATPSGPRNVSALAAVAMESGTTRYDLPFAVDIPNKSATMVLLTAKKVPGESIFLFAPDGGVPESSLHPFRVARFTNDTKGLLERGPIAVFDEGAFLGQGMVDPLPPGATATVPFALERAIGVESSHAENEEGARLAKVESGFIEIERDWVMHTRYALKNGGDAEARVLVKHPRAAEAHLHDPPKGTEDNTGTGTALIPVMVPKHGQGTLDVDERRVFRRGVDWLSQLADDAVKAYMADARADQTVVAQLRAAWEIRTKLRAAIDERDKLVIEQNLLEEQSEQLRANIKAIEKNKAADQLRRELTERLSKASARLDEITKRRIVVDMTIGEQQIRFRDLVAPIKMLKPPAAA